jgi:hypothetical protein
MTEIGIEEETVIEGGTGTEEATVIGTGIETGVAGIEIETTEIGTEEEGLDSMTVMVIAIAQTAMMTVGGMMTVILALIAINHLRSLIINHQNLNPAHNPQDLASASLSGIQSQLLCFHIQGR